MKYIDNDNLPVDVRDKKLPKDDNKTYKMFYNYKIRTEGGFADAVLLSAIMFSVLLFGLLMMLLIRQGWCYDREYT